MNIKKSILLRVRVAFLLVALFAIAIVAKVAKVQFGEGEKWRELADQINVKYMTVKATRGNIYSDNGSLLATSLPFYKVAFDATIASEKVFNEGVDSLAYLLSRHFKDHSKETYKRKLKNARATGRQYMIINRQQVGYQTKKMMSEWPVFRHGRLGGGVIFHKVDKRFSPFSNLSKRTIGFINENNRGAGLEYSFNEQLAGKDGEALYQKIAGGNWKPVFDGSEVKTENGFDIETTIDINLQDVSETALLRALEYHEADYGVVVVMEVKTGEIKAISNLSRNSKGYYHEQYNYAVGGLREPGSTFKLATMIALLEDSNISLGDSIDTGNGIFKFYSDYVRDHDEGGYGTITIREAFEKSSNVAMAKLVDRHFGLKPDRFLHYIDHLGLSQPLGLQIKGEGMPNIKRPNSKAWSGITLPWMAYGYGLELTPMQTLTLYNAVANNGKMIKPVIVKKVRKADKVLEEYETVVLNKKICSHETLAKLKVMLEGVVERGTASNINNAHYKIAGKTGTAQILENGKYTKKYITSFAGYFPADNPKYSAVVLIRNPKGWRQYGSNVAAPVFKEIADNIYSRDINMHEEMPGDFVADAGVFPVIRSGYHDELKFLCNELGISNHSAGDEDWVTTQRFGNSIKWKDNKVNPQFVPDVSGMTLRDAIYLLENCGLRVNINGKGRVSRQSQLPGTKALKGSTITIELS
ncbi:Cell division protein FtsI [Fulvivirga imtechensis AK7]|uniref:Cell division protein FtsI n=1 Tax=Fulvivirga imtechensis AK7 TaxID=1237149 RepID=L8JSB7_9BACT|nr:penicillin-binding protein [Fulvivirga imtechensis]ELR71861.1 Cell division protein FtsI [Fulvivirga imtechensis AK7]